LSYATWPLRLLLIGATLAIAQSVSLRVTDAWIRITPGAPVAAAYLTVHNSGTTPATITAVRSPLARSAMIHETSYQNQQARMRPRAQLQVAPGQTLNFEQSGLHVMLQDLTQTLAAGQKVPLVISLADGSTVPATAVVRAPGAE
jgi:periplasmic copper chaperone A